MTAPTLHRISLTNKHDFLLVELLEHKLEILESRLYYSQSLGLAEFQTSPEEMSVNSEQGAQNQRT